MRLVYISDLVSDPIKADSEYDTEDVNLLCTAFQQHSIALEAYILPRDHLNAVTTTARNALRRLASASPDALWSEAPANEIRSLKCTPMCKRPPVPQSTARLTLDMGPHVRIPVWVFNRVVEDKLPSLKMLMSAPLPGEAASAEDMLREVARNSSLVTTAPPPASDNAGGAAASHAASEPEGGMEGKHVAPEDTMPAYRYGKDLIPLHKVEEEELTYVFLTGATEPDRADKPLDKCLQLVGSVPLDRVPRKMWLDAAHLVMPVPPKDHPSGLWASGGVDTAVATKSANALCALAHALNDNNLAAIVRMRLRGSSDVRMAALTTVRSKDGIAPFLALNVLPFSEDIRLYPFKPLPLDASAGTDERAVAAMAAAAAAAEELVARMMFPGEPASGDFAATGDNRTVWNPAIQRVAEILKRRALDPQAPLVPWDASMVPQPVGCADAHAAAVAFAAAAPTKARQVRGFAGSGGQSADGAADDGPDAKRAKQTSDDGELQEGMPHIRSTCPGADFETAMAALTQEAAAVDKVLDLMRALCDTLWALLDFDGPRAWPAVIAALPPLRAACVLRRLAGTYHNVLHILRDKSAGMADGGVWGALQEAAKLNSVGPITTLDVGSDVQGAMGEDEGAAFMASSPASVAEAQAAAGDTLPLSADALAGIAVDDGGGEMDFDMD